MHSITTLTSRLLRHSTPSTRLLRSLARLTAHSPLARYSTLALTLTPARTTTLHTPLTLHTSHILLHFSTLASQLGSPDEIAELSRFAATFTRVDIPATSFQIQHARSSGAGGQNVNKVNSKVELRFVLQQARWLPELVRRVMAVQYKRYLNNQGEFVMTSVSKAESPSDCLACTGLPSLTFCFLFRLLFLTTALLHFIICMVCTGASSHTACQL